jgi:predicted lysophospholipase L1 biosynthesis ABC-type transport system permease subunit
MTNDKQATKRRAGRGFLLRFAAESHLKVIKRAAAKEQAPHRKQMGRRYPNLSLFIIEAAMEKAQRLLDE